MKNVAWGISKLSRSKIAHFWFIDSRNVTAVTGCTSTSELAKNVRMAGDEARRCIACSKKHA